MTGSLAFIEIMLAQSALQKSGYYYGPVDGNLSESARQALMGFQKNDGLEVTGELDDELFRRLLALRQERAHSIVDDLKFQARNIVNDIQAAAAFLQERGFMRIMYWADWDGMFAVDGKTRSSFFFPTDMSLEEAEKQIIENRKLYGLSATSH